MPLALLQIGMIGSSSSTSGALSSSRLSPKPARPKASNSSQSGQPLSVGKQKMSTAPAIRSRARHVAISTSLGGNAAPTGFGGRSAQAAKAAPKAKVAATHDDFCQKPACPETLASVSTTQSCGPRHTASDATARAAPCSRSCARPASERVASTTWARAKAKATAMRQNSDATIWPSISGAAMHKKSTQTRRPAPLSACAASTASRKPFESTMRNICGVYLCVSYLFTGRPKRSSLTTRAKARAQLAIHHTAVQMIVTVSIPHIQSGSFSSYS
mmetsp:Transcript_6075/g.17987  ORF Transcript_6075/g.17987 Transcript_6075/m.17987 type:complete len:273 (-) Transcript_6075:312-1130(-)